ncbi:MAG: hypothetical protein M3Y71_04670 [Actinomycetota bacterium]|nr:hypothetical protein [Actinomycetota bacterium]
MSGLWLFLRLRSVPLVTVLVLVIAVGFTAVDTWQLRVGQVPLRVDVPITSIQPLVLALLYFLTQFSPMAAVDALGGSRMTRRRLALHAVTIAGTVGLLLAVGSLHATPDTVITVRSYLLYVVMASAAGLVLHELGFALLVIYWVFCSIFGVEPNTGAQWWAVPYLDGGRTSWLTATATAAVVAGACLAVSRLRGDGGSA